VKEDKSMEGNLLYTWAKIAGVAGASLGFLALILRIVLHQGHLLRLNKRSLFILLTMIVVVAWTTALAGIVCWYLIETKVITSGIAYRVRHVRPDDSLSVREGPGSGNRETVRIPPDGRDIFIIGETTKAPG
jgi:hypothetical protein